MGKFDLTQNDIEQNINRFLTYIYASSIRSKNPEVAFIVGGPGAGKSGIEIFLKNKFKQKGEKGTIVSSDKIAEFHPYYEEILQELIPAECYRVTRQFVRPATPIIYQELQKNRINILNENVFNKGEADIQLVESFKKANYKISIHIMATDIYANRLSCYEREAKMLECGDSPRGIDKKSHLEMYDAFTKEIEQLQSMNLCDEINVYKRGNSISKPELIYQSGDRRYHNFVEALYDQRDKQRKEMISNPADYLMRIKQTMDSIRLNGVNPLLTENAINGLQELQEDFIKELNQEKSRE